MKTHARKEPESPSLLRFIKRAPPRKLPIELKEIKREPKQVKLSAKPRAKNQQESVQELDARLPPPPPRRPRRKPTLEPNPFIAPSNLVASDLDEQSPQLRIAHVRHFHQLRDKFPILDKKCIGPQIKKDSELDYEDFNSSFASMPKIK